MSTKLHVQIFKAILVTPKIVNSKIDTLWYIHNMKKKHTILRNSVDKPQNIILSEDAKHKIVHYV